MAREPATTDVRLMRDFSDMRPVDIARAYGYQRIASLLDPARPVELLAYITAGLACFKGSDVGRGLLQMMKDGSQSGDRRCLQLPPGQCSVAAVKPDEGAADDLHF